MITATRIIRNAPAPFDGEIALDYEGRLLRRKKLACGTGDFLVDLPEVTSLEDGDAFELSDGRRIVTRAKPEPVLVIRGHLARLAWHIGNRHAPCELGEGWLRVPADRPMAQMLRTLGGEVTEVEAPFRPEGGAYGEGATLGHSHGPGGEALGLGDLSPRAHDR